MNIPNSIAWYERKRGMYEMLYERAFREPEPMEMQIEGHIVRGTPEEMADLIYRLRPDNATQAEDT